MPLIRIEVTAEDIDQGEPNNGYSCPVARAIRRHVKPGNYATEMNLYFAFGLFRIKPPDGVRRFMRRFDDHCPVEPFTFDIDIPVEALE